MRYLVLIIAFPLVFSSLKAQDIHFSQMRFSPLNLNPALAGAEHTVQAIINYRDQWRSVAFPYKTTAASVDWRFKQKRGANGFLAGGLNLFNDQAGDVRMTTTNVSLSLAYHLYIDSKSTIGLAIQGGMGQRGINPSNGVWANQYDGVGFNSAIGSGESFESLNFTHLDAGAGVVYHYKKNEKYMRGNDQFKLTTGFGVFHVNRPTSAFLSNGEDDLAMRFSGFVNADYGIRNSNFSLVPAIYYNRQGPHQEVLGGTYIRVIVTEGSKITGFVQAIATSFGAFYRFGDAFVTKFMLEYSNYSFGLSYDFNVSSLTEASRGRGGVEFFLRFALPKPFGYTSRTRIN